MKLKTLFYTVIALTALASCQPKYENNISASINKTIGNHHYQTDSISYEGKPALFVQTENLVTKSKENYLDIANDGSLDLMVNETGNVYEPDWMGKFTWGNTQSDLKPVTLDSFYK